METEPAGDVRSRDPFARWPRAADAALAAAVTTASTVLTEGPGDSVVYRSPGDVPVPVVLLLLAAGVALGWRRWRPLPVLAVVLTAWALTIGSGFSDLGGLALVAVYSAGRYAPDDRRTQAGLGAAVAVMVIDGLTVPLPWVETAFGVVVFGGVWYAGRRRRLRHQRVAEQARERQAERRRIVVEERTRIARELHDVVAHRVSLMTIQAGAARMVAADDPVAAQRAMGAVEAAGRQALDELRHLLGVLRPDAEPGATEPQPGLADLPRLVEQTRQAGAEVTLAMDGLPSGLPARVELSAYRIVQESLTNVLKHAGPQAHTVVRVTHDGGCVVVDVADDGRGATLLPGSSHGIIGMRERALLLGGRLDVGPRAGGGFRVHAQLPTEGVPA